MPDCGTFCEIEGTEIEDKNTEKVFNGEISIGSVVGSENLGSN